MLRICISESLILFDGEFYKQIDGVAMGSPLGPILTNIFLCFHDQIWLDSCPVEFKPVIYRRIVHDTFLLFRYKEHTEKFRHANIKFTSEIEENNFISFLLDIKINKDSNKFLKSVYCKPTFSGVFTNFDSYIPLSYKSGFISSLPYGAFKLCSNFKFFIKKLSF